VENSRSPEGRQISRNREKDYGACLSKLNLRRNWTIGLNQQGSLDHPRNVISGFRELEDCKSYLKIHEVAKGEIMRR
jgi:hypothetical protein